MVVTGVSPYRRFSSLILDVGGSNASNLVSPNTGNANIFDTSDSIILGSPLFTSEDLPYDNLDFVITGLEAQFEITCTTNSVFNSVKIELMTGNFLISDFLLNTDNETTQPSIILNGLSNQGVLPTIGGVNSIGALGSTIFFNSLANINNNTRIRFTIPDDNPDFTATIKGENTPPIPAIRAHYTFTQNHKVHVIDSSKLHVTNRSKLSIT
tara:strand:+ start:13 stop:645 length:633 start_codon:yes stop_codon:yes gene_type:complete